MAFPHFFNTNMLGFHEHKLEFAIIDEYDTFSISVLDKSLYMETPDLPVLEITKPNFKQVYRLPFTPERVNVINSYLLGSDCYTELPDGIYTFTLAVNPHEEVNYCVDYFRHAGIFKKLKELLLTYDQCDKVSAKKLQDELVEIFMLIEAFKVNAEKGKSDLANEQYKLADKLIEKYLND